MRYKDLKNKLLYEADDEAPDEGGGMSDESRAAEKALSDSLNGEGGEGDAPAPDPDADSAVDAVTSDENISKKPQNPLASKPYSERVKTMINLMQEFGYYDVDYQIQDGNKSVITIAGTLTDQHIRDIKKFAGEIKINSVVASSKIGEDKFVTTVTISNKSTLQTFRDIVGGSSDSGETPEGGEGMGGEVPDMGGEGAPSEGGGGGEEAPPAEAPTEGGGGEAAPAEAPAAAPEAPSAG